MSSNDETAVCNLGSVNLARHLTAQRDGIDWETLRSTVRTAWELPQRALIDLAAARSPYVDQSQSLNLFLASPSIGKLSSMYSYAWKSGLKTTYYLRSRPATRIQQATITSTPVAEAVACSLENPETCEACE